MPLRVGASIPLLGGSFTGDLAVDPAHLRDLHQAAGRDDEAALDATASAVAAASPSPALSAAASELPGAERRRRVRDAVEGALSDVILLGTEEQVRLAAQAASDLAAGRGVETAAIVVSLRNFIREVLDLAPVPAALAIPRQGPVRPSAAGARGGGRGEGGNAARSGGGGGAGGGGGGGLGMGTGGMKRDPTDDDESAHH